MRNQGMPVKQAAGIAGRDELHRIQGPDPPFGFEPIVELMAGREAAFRRPVERGLLDHRMQIAGYLPGYFTGHFTEYLAVHRHFGSDLPRP